MTMVIVLLTLAVAGLLVGSKKIAEEYAEAFNEAERAGVVKRR